MFPTHTHHTIHSCKARAAKIFPAELQRWGNRGWGQERPSCAQSLALCPWLGSLALDMLFASAAAAKMELKWGEFRGRERPGGVASCSK